MRAGELAEIMVKIDPKREVMIGNIEDGTAVKLLGVEPGLLYDGSKLYSEDDPQPEPDKSITSVVCLWPRDDQSRRAIEMQEREIPDHGHDVPEGEIEVVTEEVNVTQWD